MRKSIVRKVRKALRLSAKGKGRDKKLSLPKTMNPNEARFQKNVLNGLGKYEGVRLIITRTKARKYTPDFVYVHTAGEPAVYIEVKGSYKLQSEDRARLAWEIAAESCCNCFVWAKYISRGMYECEAWYGAGTRIAKGVVANNEDFTKLLKGVGCVRN